jgi:hypothetical protein
MASVSFHEGAGKAHAAVLVDGAALRGEQLDARRDGVGHADVLEHVECRQVHALHVGVAEHPVTAALHTRVHGTDVAGEGRRAQGPTGLSASTTTCCLNITHEETSGTGDTTCVPPV